VLDRLGRLTLVIAEEHVELFAEDAALGVQLLDRHLDSSAVRSGERRADPAVGVDLPDLDRLSPDHARAESRRCQTHQDRESRKAS
jgi:hypothetical protein